MSSQPSVLLVDRSPETRAVLRMALASRGAVLWEATGMEPALELTRTERPDVIVVDLETVHAANESTQAELIDLGSTVAPIVLLGTARRLKHHFPRGQFVAKPYDYAPLIRKIEGVLDEARRKGNRGA